MTNAFIKLKNDTIEEEKILASQIDQSYITKPRGNSPYRSPEQIIK